MPNFDNVRGYLIKHKIPAMYLEDLHLEVLSKKKKAMDMLGMTADNDYRISFEVGVTDDDIVSDDNLCHIFDKIRAFIIGKFPNTESISFCENRIKYKGDKNSYKVSKLLSGYTKEIYQMVGGVMVANDMITHQVTASNIITDLFSLLKPATVYLSGNTADIISNSSEDWGNCYNPGNCHFAAGASHARDRFSFILFTLRSGVGINEYLSCRYAGRAWCYVMPDEMFFLINKTYGSFNGVRRNASVLLLQSKFKDSGIYTGEWNTVNKCYNNYDSTVSEVYFDGAYTAVTYGVPIKPKRQLPTLCFEPSVCLACGDEISDYDDDADSCRGLCGRCVDLKYCMVCKKIIANDKMFKVHTASGGASSVDHICSKECADKIAIECTKCGKHFINTDMVRSNSGVFCPTCYKNNFRKCSDCGEMFDVASDHIVAIGKDRYICKNCIEPAIKRGNLRRCDICGGVYSMDKKIKHSNKYCTVCLNHSVVTCGKCGKDIVGDMAVFKWSGKWDTYCRDCTPDTVATKPYKKAACKKKDKTALIKTCR